MNPKEILLVAIGNVLEKIGFFPPDGSDHYYGYGPACDRYGDCRDGDDSEKLAKYRKIFCQQPPLATTDERL